MSSHCSHLNFVVTDSPNTAGCEECLARGEAWVQLHICRTCGHVGCCDDSKNKHATKHFRDTHHPIVTALGPGDRSWCYVDEITLDLH